MKEIKINLSEEDMQDLDRGANFHWEFEGVPVHIFKGEDDDI